MSVDGGWVLTQAGLAALVDKVGGVPAEVDVDVVTKAADGTETVVVRAGSQHLNGAQAAAYATYAAPEEPEQARLARFNDVLDGVLRGLPDQPREIEGTVTSLKAGSSSTLSSSLLAEILAGAQAVSTDGDMLSDVLPVNAIATGAGEESYGVNAQQAAALMEARFAPSLVKDTAGGPVRVLVQNGVGTPGLVDKARTKLVKAGFRFVNGNNAPEFGQKNERGAHPRQHARQRPARRRRWLPRWGCPPARSGCPGRVRPWRRSSSSWARISSPEPGACHPGGDSNQQGDRRTCPFRPAPASS